MNKARWDQASPSPAPHPRADQALRAPVLHPKTDEAGLVPTIASMKIAGVNCVASQEMREIKETFDHDMNDLSRPLQIPIRLNKAGMAGGGAVPVVHVGPDDQID